MPYATSKLRELRRERGIKTGEMAQRCGVSMRHLVKVEGGLCVGSTELLHRIARELGVQVESVIDRPPNKPGPSRPEPGKPKPTPPPKSSAA